MSVDRSYRGQSMSNEHKMIDIQYEIQKLHSDINLFCYPEGRMNDHIINQVENAGYDYGVVTPPVKGIPNSKYTLRRVGIYQNTKMFQFKLKSMAIIQKFIEQTRKDNY